MKTVTIQLKHFLPVLLRVRGTQPRRIIQRALTISFGAAEGAFLVLDDPNQEPDLRNRTFEGTFRGSIVNSKGKVLHEKVEMSVFISGSPLEERARQNIKRRAFSAKPRIVHHDKRQAVTA